MTAPSPEVAAALRDLVHRYAAYADHRALDDLAGLFDADGVLVTPAGAHQGRETIRLHLSALDRVEATQHLVAGEVFDLAEDGHATGRVTAEAHHWTGDRDHVWHLVYRDRYVRRDGRWLFAHRTLDVRSTEDRDRTRPSPT
jgi:uncharacterized protein (TIGR02246 family)